MSWSQFVDAINDPFLRLGGFELTVVFLAKLALLPILLIFAARAVRSGMQRLLQRAPGVDTGTRNAVATVIYYIFLALGTMWVLGQLGLDTSSLAVFSGGLGVGVGIGLQDTAKNFFSGLIMLFSRTVKPTDVITVGDLTGEVESIGAYSTTMRTIQDATVIVPNSQILSEQFVNWTHDRRQRMVEISIGVHYASDLDVVEECLAEAARRTDGLLADPPPQFLLAEFADSAVVYHARVWTKEVMRYYRIVSAFNRHAAQLFAERGVVIPYPQQDLYIKEWPARPKD